MTWTPNLSLIALARTKRNEAEEAYREAICRAVAEGEPKIDVAAVAHISRPTLDAILKRR